MESGRAAGSAPGSSIASVLRDIGSNLVIESVFGSATHTWPPPDVIACESIGVSNAPATSPEAGSSRDTVASGPPLEPNPAVIHTDPSPTATPVGEPSIPRELTSPVRSSTQ
jgi:hypothetical protein